MSVPLKMQNITKCFSGIIANYQVNLEIEKGEIHAIVGENGAGKTTLMNILYGLYRPDSGEIFLDNKKVNIKNPRIAIALGIGMVHQHFMLIPPLTCAENIILGKEPAKNFKLDYKKALKIVEELSLKYGLKIEPKTKIEDLSVGMEQRVEILKLIYRGAEILIFDEPTAVLTPQETEELFLIFKELTKQGRTIIFITHKLNEVMTASDRITVMRRGKVAALLKTKDTNKEEIAKMMVGREVILNLEKKTTPITDIVLEVKNLKALNDRHLPALNDVSFSVRKGEIVGIAGIAGNGQSELAEVLTNLRKIQSGEILIKGKNLAHIPEDRLKRGLILNYTLAENLILGYHRQKQFSSVCKLNFKNINDFAENLIKDFDIRPQNKDFKANWLSGGNQQKIIIAREFSFEPDLLIVAQPTRGVDIGAIEFIHRKLLEKKEQGKAILLISLELDEIMTLADRILVFYEGKIIGEVNPREIEEHKLGLMMAGVVNA
ncbi:MAG: ABC transporter ATP-binding protein [Armatimonadetes bacterium]|nr:ABC transporter ATP-binding protein [Armatimonadota bacterium]